MGIKTAVLREHEKTLLDILANNLFGAGRKVDFNSVDLNAVWCEAYTQAVSLMAFYNTSENMWDNEKHSYIHKKLSQALTVNTHNDFEHIRIHNIMTQAGIPYTILKGFASALYYPDPLMRSMGDVDFLVDGDYITHDARINFNGSATMTPATSESGEWENVVRFVTSGKGTVTVYWMHAGKGSEGENDEKSWRNVGLWDAEGNLVAQSEGQHDYEATIVTTFEFDKAGTYYLGNVAHANYFFYVEVVHEGAEVELDPVPVYTVAFESNGGSAVDSIEVAAGTFFKKPTDPTRDGYMFDG